MVTYKGAPIGPSADFQQKPNRLGGNRMTFSKYSKIKLVAQEYYIQQSYYSDMAGKYLPNKQKLRE